MNFGTTEILLILAVIFLLFGASRLPQLAKSIGQTRKAFKDGIREAEEEAQIERQVKTMPSSPKTTALNAPQVTAMSDEEIIAEMRRRAAVKLPS